MVAHPSEKYRPFPPINLPSRSWPARVISRAPRFCSVDLRDGNQALVEPMGLARKLELWDALVRMGFREIEVGFPAASQPDFDFVRHIVEHDLIPEDVTIQVLTQSRGELITRTLEAVRGARRAIVHLYNSTSELQRRVVFGLDRAAIVDIAVAGTRLIKTLAERMPETEIVLEYSPESFTGTELDFARDVCEAVMDAWQPTPERKVILNLPATVEVATPNVYADQIEWMHENLSRRDSIVLSVHPHNDRGTAVAAAELALLAGADRVEGTLFGNGERTGNVCVVTLAMNLFSQGIDPTLDLSNLDALKQLVERVNRLPVHPRHPYAGELVYTAFSGSHQDAIKKGLSARERSGSPLWEVPYLPIDPADVGRTYEAVIRVNSQSGKSGVAYVLEHDFGYLLPKALASDVSQHVQREAERTEGEVKPTDIARLFEQEYVNREGPLRLLGHESRSVAEGEEHVMHVTWHGQTQRLMAHGNGPIDAFARAVGTQTQHAIRVEHYSEHALTSGADAVAVAYVSVVDTRGARSFGVGRHPSIVTASLAAITSAINRLEVNHLRLAAE
jgi:2-isopropylmalate synthase